ncbi:MAG: DNA polymerase III subunit delta [Candidatus Zixiibacteriota bacterium]
MTSPQKLFDQLRNGQFQRAYYFFGAENYRIAEAEKFVAGAFLPDQQMILNYRKFDGRRTACRDLLAHLANLPMLGERQVVGVSNIQSYRPTDLERILKMLTPPDPNRVVIFSSPSSKAPKKRSSFFSTISKITETVEFRRLLPEEIGRQISSRMKKTGIEIDHSALKLLVELLAGDRGGLESEISKLIDYKEGEGRVTQEDVRNLCSGYELYNVFELGQVIVAGDAGRALRMVESLIAGGANPSSMVTLLHQHLVCLYLVKAGKPPLKRREFLASRYRQQASRFSDRELQQMILKAADAESVSRQGRLNPALAFQTLLFELLEVKK